MNQNSNLSIVTFTHKKSATMSYSGTKNILLTVTIELAQQASPLQALLSLQ